MANGPHSPEPTFLWQHQAWIESRSGEAGADNRVFFTDALIVLDANVLLDLYRYSSGARNQVLAALRLVKPRLWLPHRVGSEFIRSRRGVVADRTEKLQKAKSHVDGPLREAWKSVQEALDGVKGLLDQLAADEPGQAELDDLINEEGFKQLIEPWRNKLNERVDELKSSHDIKLMDIVNGSDPILPEVAALYESRFAAEPDASEVRRHIEHALSYRYPNKIPPGFLDADKPTPIQAAGDYLIWEEMIKHVQAQPEQGRVLFVSGDTKPDWYEPGRSRSEPPRPWPSLIDEFRARTSAELMIMESRAFFLGVSNFLDAKFTASTVEEIGRTAESREGESDLSEVTELAVTHLLDQLKSGTSTQDLLDSYLYAKRLLAESMQAVIRVDLTEPNKSFSIFRKQLQTAISDRYAGQIPDRYLKVPYGSRVHEELFGILLQHQGTPVQAALLRIVTGDSVHTERRLRELRELGLDIQTSRESDHDYYTLGSLSITMSFAHAIVANLIKNDRELLPAEKQALLDQIDYQVE